MSSMAELREQQEEEIEVLTSIYSEEEFLKLNASDKSLTDVFSRSGSIIEARGDESQSAEGAAAPAASVDPDDGGNLISGDFSSHLQLESEFTIKGMFRFINA